MYGLKLKVFKYFNSIRGLWLTCMIKWYKGNYLLMFVINEHACLPIFEQFSNRLAVSSKEAKGH